jgi:hypothetical protein
MATMRQYLYKSVKNFFLLLASIIALILVCVFISRFFPYRFQSGLVLASLHFIKQIGFVFAFGIFILFAYKAFKVFRTAEFPGREFAKMTPAVIVWLVIIFLAAVALDSYRDGGDCQNYNYNEKLNGGVKIFNGEKYTINLCGSGGNDSRFFGDGMDTVQLTVLDEQGALLARRRYKVYWDAEPGHEPIVVEKDRLSYYDDEAGDGLRSVAMPPTWLDWIRARLPLVD